ncbi:MAG: hypothetical protein ABJN36_20565 [Cyclobacteriaceae bacterium]
MKDLRYIGIQGWNASRFWFRNHDSHILRVLIESVTASKACIISSIYRTDVFYYSETDQSALIFKMWCQLKGLNHNTPTLGQFVIGENRKTSISLFFDTIYHLKLHPSYFKRYRNSLNELMKQESNNAILKEIEDCDNYLLRSAASERCIYTPLKKLKNKVRKASASLKNFESLIYQTLPDINYN